MKQTKLNPDDPDYQTINPVILDMALTNGNVRQPIELYLTGKVTWRQALETMVIAIGKEFRAQQRILVEVQMQNSNPQLTLHHASQMQLPALQSGSENK